MKKRINDSEIEAAKKSTKVMLVIISFFIILLICLGIYIAYLYKEGKIFKTDDGKYVIEEQLVKKDVIKKLDINDTNIIELFEHVKVTNEPCPDGSYQNKKELKVENLNDKCKYHIASKIYNEEIQYDNDKMITYVTEQNVKKAYESLFEVGSYERQETVPYVGTTELMYNIDNKIYFINGGKVEPVATPFKTFEKIIEVKKIDNDLYISSNTLYYDSINSVLCKESSCETIVEQLSKNSEYNDDYFNLYLESKKDKLYKYTYHFKLNEAGFYKYKGYERTN